MKPWIEAVLSLQSLDMKIRAYKTKLSAIPIERARLNDEQKSAQNKVDAAKNELRNIEKKIKDLETRTAGIDENIKKLLTQSIMVKKNTEYQTMMADIENKKKEISDIETEEIALLDDVETAKTKIKAEEHDFTVCAKAVKTDLRDLDELENEVNEELKNIQSLREAHAAKVERAVIDTYERLLKTDKAEPMGKLTPDGTCSCCGCKVTPQTAGNTKKGQITFCDNCSHLLYYEP